eukprot:jgi/Antlo1/341/806
MENNSKKEAWKKMVYMYSKAVMKTDSSNALDIRSNDKSSNIECIKNNTKTNNDKRSSKRQKAVDGTECVRFKLLVKSSGQIEIKPSNKIISTFLSKYDQTLVKYQVKSNSWVFDHTIYNSLTKELDTHNLQYERIPKGTLSIIGKKLNVVNFNLKDDIYSMLLPFQKEGVCFALNRNGRVILADDMGLGKTIQALAIANYYKLEWPLLIITPASLLDNWYQSVNKFLDAECYVVRKKEDLGENVCIISYDMASKHSEALRNVGYKVIVVDECHYLKSTTTKRTSKILPLLQKAIRVILISGTPALSRPVELYPLISAVDKNIYPNFFEYGKRYCNGRKINNWYDYKGCSNAEELFFVLNKILMIRRTKDEVMSELPPKTRRHVILSVNVSDDNIDIGDIEKPNVEIMKKYVEAAEMKLNAVIEYVNNMLEKNVKFLIYAHHTVMMDGIERFLQEKNVGFVKIDGGTPSYQRQTNCDIFQTKNEIKVALLSLTAASTGITLTAGRAVVFAELYWNPGTLLQAEDRIHRIGQKCCVDIHYLLAKNTVDEYVWPKLLKKLNVLESLGIGTNELKNVKEAKNEQQGRLDIYINK